MTKLRQTFHNSGKRPLFVNLELSTSRYRLGPGEELILLYDLADRPVDDNAATLRIEVISGADGPELAIWTAEMEMFRSDGQATSQDFSSV